MQGLEKLLLLSFSNLGTETRFELGVLNLTCGSLGSPVLSLLVCGGFFLFIRFPQTFDLLTLFFFH